MKCTIQPLAEGPLLVLSCLPRDGPWGQDLPWQRISQRQGRSECGPERILLKGEKGRSSNVIPSVDCTSRMAGREVKAQHGREGNRGEGWGPHWAWTKILGVGIKVATEVTNLFARGFFSAISPPPGNPASQIISPCSVSHCPPDAHFPEPPQGVDSQLLWSKGNHLLRKRTHAEHLLGTFGH